MNVKKICFSIFGLIMSFFLLVPSAHAFTKVPQQDILNDLYEMEYRDYSKVIFRIDPNYDGLTVKERLALLKSPGDPVVFTVTVKSEQQVIDALQPALDSVRTATHPVKIYLPVGNYKVTKSLRIYSDTWLRLADGVTMTRNSSARFPFIMNGDPVANYYGYNGQSNIIIDGGVWDSNSHVFGTGSTTFNIAHGNNIIIENLTIKNVYDGHAMDLTADRNVLVRNNQFLGFKNSDGKHDYVEAIQLDGFLSEKSFHSFGAVDHTVTKNVIVHNNVFGQSDVSGMGSWAVGVGGHSVSYQNPYQNIYVKYNTFNNHTYSAIRARYWSNVEIYENTFNNNEKGVWLDVAKYSINKKGEEVEEILPMDNIVIRDNTFNGTKTLDIDTEGNLNTYKLTNTLIYRNVYND